ncbi:hypothetical protein J3F83DRAFT_747221 [Trichoderma novae-zelandiae]
MPTADSRPNIGLSEPSILLPFADGAERDEGPLTSTGSTMHDHVGNEELTPSLFQQRSPECLESSHCSLAETQTAHDPISLARKHKVEDELNYIFFGTKEDPFATEAATLNYDPLPVDIGSTTTFDEWLYTSKSGLEYLGDSCPAYEDVGVSLYNS